MIEKEQLEKIFADFEERGDNYEHIMSLALILKVLVMVVEVAYDKFGDDLEHIRPFIVQFVTDCINKMGGEDIDLFKSYEENHIKEYIETGVDHDIYEEIENFNKALKYLNEN